MAAVKKTRQQILNEYGVNPSSVSSHDMELYDKNYDAFESIAANKSAYAKAQAAGDTAGMKKANDNANRIRSTYSQYTGGTDGMGYTVSPKYEIDKPTYTSAYQGDINDALQAVLNRGEFSNKDYDLDSDPVWQAYKSKYEREGDLAMRDTLGLAAGKTGGIAGSAALTAAQQAKNYYNAQMTDVIPQLYEAAYARYADETKNMNDRLQLLRDMEATEYGRHRDDVGDWERTRDYYNNNYMWQTESDNALTQAAYDNAMNKFQTTGMVDDSIADVLKLVAGTKTADYDLTQQQMANDEKWNADASNQNWAKIAQSQQTIDNDIRAQRMNEALSISEQYGYVPNETIASLLGVAVGTPTSDAAFRQKQLNFEKEQFERSKSEFDQEMAYKNAQMTSDNDYRYDALNYEDNQLTDLPQIYEDMMRSGNPAQWLNENASIMTAAELQALLKLISGGSKSSSSGAAAALG